MCITRRWVWLALLVVLLCPLIGMAQGLSLSLEEALSLALERSPLLAADAAGVAAAEAEQRQAAAGPNPTLGLQTQFDAFERMSLIGLNVSQTLELGGKREARTALAEARLEESRLQERERRRQVRALVHTAFADLLLAQRREEHAREALELAQRLKELGRQRFERGDVAEVEVVRLEAEVSQERAGLARAQGQRLAAAARLSGYLGSELVEIAARGRLGQVQTPELAWLLDRVAERPDLALARARLESTRRAVRLEEARGVSDLTVGGGVLWQRDFFPAEAFAPRGIITRLDDTGPRLNLQLQIPLPLNDTNQGNIEAARARVDRQEHLLAAAVEQARAAVTEAHQQLVAASEVRRILEEEVVPQAFRSLEVAIEAYRLGYRSQVEVLEIRRIYLQQALEALAAAHREELALAELEAAVGALSEEEES